MQQPVNSCVMDIDEKLNDIIFKYHLDDVYPDYKKMLQAEKLVEELAKSWIGKGKIACIVTYDSDIHHWKHFLREGQNVEFIRCVKKAIPETCDEVYDLEKKFFGKKWQEYSGVYILSLSGAAFIKRWLRMHAVEHVFLYDYFALHGLYFSKDWDTLLSDDSMEYWTERYWTKLKQNYISMEIMDVLAELETDKDVVLKRLHWKKAFFLALYIRDFCLAEDLIQSISVVSDAEKQAWADITKLLCNIRQNLHSCQRRDMLVLWTDAIPYEEIDKIKYLREKMDKGICFDNMFTVVAYTNPTLKAMLCNKMPIDDDSYSIHEISSKNSIVYRDLEKAGYKIVTIGGYWPAISPVNRSDRYHRAYVPTSMILWDLWRNVLRESNTCFFLAHAFLESHGPHLSIGVEDQYWDSDDTRCSVGCAYLDKQYKFYLDALPTNMVKFYMTDHGNIKYQNCFHVYFVAETGEPARHVREMCSYYDFCKLLRQVIRKEPVNENAFARKFIKVQDLDCYSPVINSLWIKRRVRGHMRVVGYHGVIDKTHIYLKFTNGMEWFVRRGRVSEEPNLFVEHIEDANQIEKYRSLLGEIPEPSPAIKKKLRYAKYLQKVYENARPRNERKYKLLNEWIQGFPKGSLVIRTGGLNAVSFYEFLEQENRKRIVGFIDQNADCSAIKFGKPIFSDIQAIPDSVQGILFVSYKLLPILSEEAKHYPKRVKVMNPYAYLAEKGIICKTGVAEYELTAEDCDVGFPFDEIDEEI